VCSPGVGSSLLAAVALAWRWPGVVAVCVFAFGSLILGAAPAGAHGVGGLKPTDYEVRLTSIEPRVAGVSIVVVDLGQRLQLTNTSGRDVTVLGYAGEPYLRVGPTGVYENTRSPATYLNQTFQLTTAPPAIADANASPHWERISDGDTVRWHDHRAHSWGRVTRHRCNAIATIPT
jgi:hypothetical protein